MIACQCLSAHAHRMPTTTSEKVFVSTKNCYTSRLNSVKRIAASRSSPKPSTSTLFSRVLFLLPALHCFNNCPSNLSCMFKSQNWVEYFLMSFEQTLWRPHCLVTPRMRMCVGIPIKFCQSFDISLLRTTVVLSDWKSTKFVEICIPLHSGSL